VVKVAARAAVDSEKAQRQEPAKGKAVVAAGAAPVRVAVVKARAVAKVAARAVGGKPQIHTHRETRRCLH